MEAQKKVVSYANVIDKRCCVKVFFVLIIIFSPFVVDRTVSAHSENNSPPLQFYNLAKGNINL